MSTWSLEHIPAAGGASTVAALKVWGVTSFQWQRVNWGIDTLQLIIRGGSPAFTAPGWAYLDKVVLWRDGVRFAHAWVTSTTSVAQTAQARGYTLQGPGWWLTQYAPSYDPAFVIYYAGTFISRAIGNAITAGAPLACDDSVAAALDVHCPEVRTSANVLALLQSASRYAPLSAGWWDYAPEVPVFHAARRGGLTAVDLVRNQYVEVFELSPRHDLQLLSVRLRFGWTGGASYYFDTAGEGALDEQGPNRLRVALTFATQELAEAGAGRQIADKLLTDLGPLCWTGTIALHEAAVALPDVCPGTAVNLDGAGCLEDWATMAAVVQQATYTHDRGTDTASIQLGAPEHLGPQDYLEFASLAYESAKAADEPVEAAEDPIPGTLKDLNDALGLGGIPGGTVAIQVKGGTWGKRGFASLDLSEPSRRWLTKSLSGTTVSRSHSAPDPSSDYIRTTETFSGAFAIDPATNVASGQWDRHQLFVYPDTSTAESNWYAGTSTEYFVGNSIPTVLDQDDKVSHLRALTSATLAANAYVSGNYWAVESASAAITLASEDTKGAAVARMMESAEWTAPSGDATAIDTVPTTLTTGIWRALRYRTEHQEPIIESVWVPGHYVGEEPNRVWVDGAYVDTVTGYTTIETLTNMAHGQRYRLRLDVTRTPVNEAGAATGDPAVTSVEYGPAFITDMSGEGGHDWVEIEAGEGFAMSFTATPEIY